MQRNRDVYQEPLVSRYTSPEMQRLFSERYKFTNWRRCWIALAEAQYEMGLKAVSSEMIAELKAHANDINFEVAEAKEKEIRHDVMAHVFAYGQQCPLAEPIIHLGATSQFVVCNTDLIVQKQGLKLIQAALLRTIMNLSRFARKYAALPTLGYTHYQPAQPTTVGKRTTLYIQDLLMDLDYISHLHNQVKARGAKGTVGTQATFLELFEGDQADDDAGEHAVVDLRLLANLKVQEEPFEEKQVGSSAMAYKRNPMRSERMTGLARKLMGLPANFAATAGNQWFERTLDDSAIRRMDIAQAFLLTDAVLRLYINISENMVVYPKQIEKHLQEELPFMATEKILMACVEHGESRQSMHEVIREHSVAAGLEVKENGGNNDLLKRLGEDARIPFSTAELEALLTDYQSFTGRAEAQTVEFLEEVVEPILKQHAGEVSTTDISLHV